MRALGAAFVVVGALVAVWGVSLFVKAAGGGEDVGSGTLVGIGVLLLVCGAVFVTAGVMLTRR